MNKKIDSKISTFEKINDIFKHVDELFKMRTNNAKEQFDLINKILNAINQNFKMKNKFFDTLGTNKISSDLFFLSMKNLEHQLINNNMNINNDDHYVNVNGKSKLDDELIVKNIFKDIIKIEKWIMNDCKWINAQLENDLNIENVTIRRLIRNWEKKYNIEINLFKTHILEYRRMIVENIKIIEIDKNTWKLRKEYYMDRTNYLFDTGLDN